MKIYFFIAAVLILTACPFDKNDPEYTGHLSCKYSAHSQKGAMVCSGEKIAASISAAVDLGLDRAFWIASQPPNNYSGFQRHSTYTIWLFPPNREKCINPAVYRLFRGANVYDQGPFDKDPRPGYTGLCFAGFMLRGNVSPAIPTGTPGMLIVDDPATVERVTWFEAEHNILLEVDGPRYQATADLHNHPIMGYGPPCECVIAPCPCSQDPQKAFSPSPAGDGITAVTLSGDIEAFLTR